MAEVEALPNQAQARFQFNWILPLFWKPKQILAQVIKSTRRVWLTPLLVLSLAAIAAVLASGPIRQAAALAGNGELPADYQYWSTEQQQQYAEAQATASGPVYIYLLPALSGLAKIWLGWLIFAAALHLALTLVGGRTGMGTIFNLVGWASVPILVRYLIQIAYILTTSQLITAPGLSGFRSDSGSMAANFWGAVLTLVDVYLIWQAGLVIVGLRNIPGVSMRQAVSGATAAAVITVILLALPGFIGQQLGGLLSSQSMYFF